MTSSNGSMTLLCQDRQLATLLGQSGRNQRRTVKSVRKRRGTMHGQANRGVRAPARQASRCSGDRDRGWWGEQRALEEGRRRRVVDYVENPGWGGAVRALIISHDEQPAISEGLLL